MSFAEFNNKIAIVTGAASGLGRGFSTVLATNGATVIAADINVEGLSSVVEQITAEGGIAEAHELDTTDAEAVTKLVDDTVAKHGRIDYIFNNAGIAAGGPAEDIPVKDWDKIIDINLKGVVYGASAAYKHMVKQRSGHIVNTASLAGLVPSPLLTPYSATKFAVVGMSDSWRAEAKHYGVTVTALCPGFIDSAIYESSLLSGGISPESTRKDIPYMVSTEKGVDRLLKGVLAKKRVVVLPFYAHWLAYSYKLFPGTVVRINGLLGRRQLATLRKQKQ